MVCADCRKPRARSVNFSMSILCPSHERTVSSSPRSGDGRINQ
jgi:hypothetical protein